MVVATTLAAFATSSPELTVSTVAAFAGQPEIGLGDALGSNVVNIALIFGLALLYGPCQTTRADFGRDFYLALGIPLLTLIFVLDGRIARGEALALLAIFCIWLASTIRIALAIGSHSCFLEAEIHTDSTRRSIPVCHYRDFYGHIEIPASARIF